MKKRVLAFFCSLALLLSAVSVTAFAAEELFGSAKLNVMEAFRDEHIGGEYREGGELLSDGVETSLPVEINTYVRETPKDASHVRTFSDPAERGVIFYCIGTAVERIGTDSDEEIIDDLLEDGWIVVVVDYQNNSEAVSPRLDWDIQKIRLLTLQKGRFLYGAEHAEKLLYILPAGYRISYNIPYFNMETEGSDGCVEHTIKVWNCDKFKTTYADTLVKWTRENGERKPTLADTPSDAWCNADGTANENGEYIKIKYTLAVTADDPVKKDGTDLDYTLYMDIIYPSDPANEVPVYIMHSASYTRVSFWTSEYRPHLSGFLFNGYAGVLIDTGVNPLCREDHYGYFDDPLHSLIGYTGLKAQTAAVRAVRYMSNADPVTYRFDQEAFGVYGHSKSGYCYQLGNPDIGPDMEEMEYFEGHHGETKEGVVQPWLTYEGGERDGQQIRSNVQFVYASSAAGAEYVCEKNFAPTFLSSGEVDFNHTVFYIRAINNSRFYDIPMLNISMPGVGHEIVYGYNPTYKVNMYEMLFDFADYVLKDASPVLEYILPLDGTKDFASGDEITLRFAGQISRAEIEEKVKVVNTYTGELATGEWIDEFGRCEWTFRPHDLKGGYSYTVLVPSDLRGENGKTLREGKSITITAKSELTVSAAGFSSDLGGTLTKTASGESGIWLTFPAITEETNTTHTALRFSVTNDAANRVGVYAVTEYNESDPSASTAGALLGTVTVIGKGDYEVDVSTYLESLSVGETPTFLLKAEKTVGTTVIKDESFDISTSANAVTDHVTSGKCWKNNSDYLNSGAIFPSGVVEAADYGRRFRISFKILLEQERTIYGNVRDNSASALYYNDYNDTSYFTAPAKANEWQTISFRYDVKDSDYWRSDIQKVNLFIAKSGATENGTEPIFLDDLLVVEEVTELCISASLSADGAAPSLVYHPANYVTPALTGGGMIANGENADTVYTGSDTLTVSGKTDGQGSETYKKVYAKLDLSAFSASRPAEIRISTTGTARGDIYVFGLTDTAASAWSAETLNYLNAVGNDRFGFGVNTDLTYESSYLARIRVLGAGTYVADVTDFASYMTAKGATEATLILVNTTQNGEILLSESYENQVYGIKTEKIGDLTASLIRTDEEDHPAGLGYSLRFTSKRKNDFIRATIFDTEAFDLSDVGRSLRASFYFKAESATNLRIDLRRSYAAGETSAEYVTQAFSQYTEVGAWQRVDFDFKITSEMIGKTLYLLVAVQPDSLTYDVQEGVSFVGYFDDLTVTDRSGGDITFTFVDADGESEEERYSYLETVEDATRVPSWGAAEKAENTVLMRDGYIAVTENFSSGVSYNGGEVGGVYFDTEQNHTEGGGKSLRVTAVKLYNRLCFYNIIKPQVGDTLTAADLGRVFRFSLWAKSDTTGSFELWVGTLGSDNPNSYYQTKQSCSVTAGGDWQLYTYEITVTQEMIDAETVNTPTVNLMFTNFGLSATNTPTGEVKLWIDDIGSRDITPRSTSGHYKKTFDFEGKSALVSTSGLSPVNTEADIIKAGNQDYLRVEITADENHTAGGSSSLLYIPNTQTAEGTYNWGTLRLYNLFDHVLTAADEGKQYRITYYIKSTVSGLIYTGFNAAAGGSGYVGSGETECLLRKDANTVAGEWTKITYDFTVTEAFYSASYTDKDGNVDTSAKYQPQLFLFAPQSAFVYGQNVPIYIDDFTIEEIVSPAADEETVTRDETRVDFEGSESVGWTSSKAQLNEYLQTMLEFHLDYNVAQVKRSTAENHTAGGTQSLFVRSDETRNALYFFNMIKPKNGSSTLTEADIGRSFTLTFYAKASKTGSFTLFLGDAIYRNAKYTAYTKKATCLVDTVDEWVKFSYDFTITADMIAAVGQNGVEGINPMIWLDGFEQQMGKAEYAVDLYFDDFVCLEHVDGAADIFGVTEAATVSNANLSDATLLTVGRGEAGSESVDGARKAYYIFAAAETTEASRVFLTLNGVGGGKLLLWGVTEAASSDRLCWNTAPGTLADEGMNEKSVFGGKPIATLSGSGTVKVDVTDYARFMDGRPMIFAVTSEEGSTLLCHLDFSSVPLHKDTDYLSDGNVTLSDGRIATDGASLTFLHLFGNETPRAGETYRLQMKLSSDAENTYTASWGNASNMTAEAADGVLTLLYTATAEDTKSGMDSVTVTAANAGFTVESLTLSREVSVTLSAEATLSIGVAQSVSFDTEDLKVKSNLTLSSDLCYNLYIPAVEPVKSIALAGKTLDLSALPTVVKDGVLYYRVTHAFAAKDAADSIALAVTVTTAEGEKSADYALSIPAYAKKIVDGESYSDATKTLMKDMLAYIDAAMTYFGTATEETHKTITDVIGESYPLPEDAEVGLTADKAVATDTASVIDTACLDLGDAPAFVFYLKEGKEDLADTFSFTSENGAPLKVEKRREDGRTLLVVTTYAYGMNDTLTFTYAGGNGSYNLAAYHHSGTTDENLAKLTVRLAKYANSAKAYKAASESAQ